MASNSQSDNFHHIFHPSRSIIFYKTALSRCFCNSQFSCDSPDVNLAGGLPKVVADLGGADPCGAAVETPLAPLGLGAARGHDLVALWVDRRTPEE